MAQNLVIVATFDPPGAQTQYEEWRARNAALLRELAEDDIRIDVGRSVGGGDFYRVWLPPDVAPRVVR